MNGKEIAALPLKGCWIFSDFVDSPDPRYRKIVEAFKEAGYVQEELDEFA